MANSDSLRLLSRSGLVLSLLGAAFIAWRIASSIASDHYARSEPDTALRWDSAHPVALVNLAEQRRRMGASTDLSAAVQVAKRAIEVEPLARNALTVLGTIAVQQGDSTKADTLMNMAAVRAPRSLLPQGYIYAQALKAKDFRRAGTALEAILRSHPNVVDEVGGTIPAFITDAGGSEELARLLSSNPPWRKSLLSALFRQWQEPDGLIRLVALVNEGPTPLHSEEFSLYLSKLIEVGRVEEAYLLWLQNLPADRLSNFTLLYNGRFQYEMSNLPFDWTIQPVRGAAVELVRGGEETVLRVGFSGARVPFSHVSHLLLLPPGEYRFSGLVKSERLQNERGLRWRISCLEDSQGSLGESDPISGSTPWKEFQTDFSVPKSACRSQMLRLELPARVALEQHISGTASYRALDIRRR
jgi:hypothetical protein